MNGWFRGTPLSGNHQIAGRKKSESRSMGDINIVIHYRYQWHSLCVLVFSQKPPPLRSRSFSIGSTGSMPTLLRTAFVCWAMSSNSWGNFDEVNGAESGELNAIQWMWKCGRSNKKQSLISPQCGGFLGLGVGFNHCLPHRIIPRWVIFHPQPHGWVVDPFTWKSEHRKLYTLWSTFT